MHNWWVVSRTTDFAKSHIHYFLFSNTCTVLQDYCNKGQWTDEHRWVVSLGLIAYETTDLVKSHIHHFLFSLHAVENYFNLGAFYCLHYFCFQFKKKVTLVSRCPNNHRPTMCGITNSTRHHQSPPLSKHPRKLEFRMSSSS